MWKRNKKQSRSYDFGNLTSHSMLVSLEQQVGPSLDQVYWSWLFEAAWPKNKKDQKSSWQNRSSSRQKKINIPIKKELQRNYLSFGVTLCKPLLYVSSNGKEDLLHIEVCFCTLLKGCQQCQCYLTNLPAPISITKQPPYQWHNKRLVMPVKSKFHGIIKVKRNQIQAKTLACKHVVMWSGLNAE